MNRLKRGGFSLIGTLALAISVSAQADVTSKASGHAYQKPGAAVSLSDAPILVLPGDTIQTTAALRLHSPVDAVSVKLLAPEGVQLLSGSTFDADAAAATVLQIPVNLYASEAGLHYVSVFVETTAAGRTASRALTLPIQVGDAPAKLRQNGVAKTTAAGRAVISMQAQETIRD